MPVRANRPKPAICRRRRIWRSRHVRGRLASRRTRIDEAVESLDGVASAPTSTVEMHFDPEASLFTRFTDGSGMAAFIMVNVSARQRPLGLFLSVASLHKPALRRIYFRLNWHSDINQGGPVSPPLLFVSRRSWCGYAEVQATLITFCAISGSVSADQEAPPSWVPNTCPRRVQK